MGSSLLQRLVGDVISRELSGYDLHENYRPEWMETLDGGRLELDFYIEDLNIAFEIQGRQHYEYVPFFHGKYEDFEAQQERDEIKRAICDQRGITLYEIACESEIASVIESLKFVIDSPRTAEIKIELNNKLRFLRNATEKQRMRIGRSEAELEQVQLACDEEMKNARFIPEKLEQRLALGKAQLELSRGKLVKKIRENSAYYDNYIVPRLVNAGLDPDLSLDSDPLRLASHLCLKTARRQSVVSGDFNSPNEAYAAFLREFDDIWTAIKTNNRERAVQEAMDIAGIALRFVSEFRAISEYDMDASRLLGRNWKA